MPVTQTQLRDCNDPSQNEIIDTNGGDCQVGQREGPQQLLAPSPTADRWGQSSLVP